MIDVVEEVNTRLQAQLRHQPDMNIALVKLFQTDFNDSYQKVITVTLLVICPQLANITRTLKTGQLSLESMAMPGHLK